ncbi:MAG: sigma-70 family RNA polymerase sigma factor [Clostridia bacterium]|nr:sigma-70 family RNA polymerase sigma factor [Clostridia bacterium]
MSSEIENLLQSVKNGETLSFEAIYRLYLPLIESTASTFCKRFSLSETDIDDLRQEAAIALYNAVFSYSPERNVTFGRYAKVCIQNRIISYIRYFHESFEMASPEELDLYMDEIDPGTPEQLIIDKESLCNLNRKIEGSLTDFEKSVFALYVGNMSYADMAKALSKPTKSIDNAIHRIKAKLRKLL